MNLRNDKHIFLYLINIFLIIFIGIKDCYATNEIDGALRQAEATMQQNHFNRDPFADDAANASNLREKNSDIVIERPSNLEDRLIAVHYVNANDIEKIISNKILNILSDGGSVATIDAYQLYIRDDAEHLNRACAFIKKLDIPRPQILINARIVTVDNQYLRNLGVLFGTQGAAGDHESSRGAKILNENIAVPILKFRDDSLLMAEITALEKEGRAELISSPELLTLNHETAVIESGEEVPYQEATASGATSVTFKKAVLRLKVIPDIMSNHQILLRLMINQDKVSGLTVNGVPAIRTQELQTQILIANRETLVLGGIMEQTDSNQEKGVPGLRHIPVVGNLFRQNQRELNRRELLIFVTPSIILANQKY